MNWPKRSFSKYGNVKSKDEEGRSFDSAMERARFRELELLQRSGHISDLKCQVQVHLTFAKILYKPDFSYIEHSVTIYEEVKGFETATWRIKRRLWMYYGPGPLRIYKGSAAYLKLDEEIIPKP